MNAHMFKHMYNFYLLYQTDSCNSQDFEPINSYGASLTAIEQGCSQHSARTLSRPKGDGA